MKKTIGAFITMLLAAVLLQSVASGQSKTDPASKKNIISVSPFLFSELGKGFGISYEHFMDKNNFVSLNLPMCHTWNSDGNTRTEFTPGIKMNFYSPSKIFAYAIGPSMLLGFGSEANPDYSAGSGSREIIGVVVNNSFNFNVASCYMGLEFGFGYSYLNKLNGMKDGDVTLAQASFKIGYRF